MWTLDSLDSIYGELATMSRSDMVDILSDVDTALARYGSGRVLTDKEESTLYTLYADVEAALDD